MSATPFITLFTPLVYIPVLFGMLMGGWDCLSIIAAGYGINLESAVPSVSVSDNVAGPFLLLGIAAFGFVQGAMMRRRKTPNDDDTPQTFGPMGWLEHLAIGAAVFALMAVPYWLALPIPEAWVIAGGALLWMGWHKFVS